MEVIDNTNIISEFDDDTFYFKSLNNLFVDLDVDSDTTDFDLKSLIKDSIIIIVTKNNSDRLKKTIKQFFNISINTLVLDDSTNKETKEFIEGIGYDNIMYFGNEKKEDFIYHFSDIDDMNMEYFISDISFNGWTLGSQRNYAILLAKALGYNKLLMIDDDIILRNSNSVLNTLNLLSNFDIVGSGTEGMPDDSIIGHLFRRIGIKSYDFISGQYSALNLNSLSYSFPNIYNEDWIVFLLESLNNNIARNSYVYQLPYSLDSRYNNTIFQEEGEIACEGVIEAVLDKDLSVLTTFNFWQNIINYRHNYIKKLETLLIDDNYKYKRVFCDINDYYSQINPQHFSSFFLRYMNNVKCWKELNSQSTKLRW